MACKGWDRDSAEVLGDDTISKKHTGPSVYENTADGVMRVDKKEEIKSTIYEKHKIYVAKK